MEEMFPGLFGHNFVETLTDAVGDGITVLDRELSALVHKFGYVFTQPLVRR